MNYLISITTVIFICLVIKKIYFKGKEKQQTNIEDENENEDFVLQYFDQFTLNEVLSGKNSAASKKHKLNKFQLGDVNIIDDQNFSFSTWECFCYFMHIENDEVTLIERVFTK